MTRDTLVLSQTSPQKVVPTQTDLEEEYFYNVDEKSGYILHILRSRNLKIEVDFFEN